MAKYSASGQSVGTADGGLVNITVFAAVRVGIFDVIIGSDDAPSDHAAEFVLNRSVSTGIGPSQTITPVALDPLTVAATAFVNGGVYASVEPADTANSELLMVSLNQRAIFRFVAFRGSELLGAAVSDNGLFLRTATTTAGYGVNATILWCE